MVSSRVVITSMVVSIGCTQVNPAFVRSEDSLGDEVGDTVATTDDAEGTTETDDATSEESTEGTSTDTTEGTSTDTTESETGPIPTCDAPLTYVDCDASDDPSQKPFHAIGINCPGPADQTIQAVGPTEFAAVDANSYRVAKYLGSAAGPNHGGKLWAAQENVFLDPGDPEFPLIPPNTSSTVLFLSTGIFHEPDNLGGLLFEPEEQETLHQNENPDLIGPPEPISPAYGSNFGQGGTPFENCDGLNDCSDSLYTGWVTNGQQSTFNDQMWMQMTLLPPEGVHGYLFDFAFFSAEWPDFGATFNDTFVAWSSSETYTGNLTFVGAAPLGASALADAGGFAYTENAPELAGTGFETHAATGWLLARGPTMPGEEVQLTFFFTDVGDGLFASVVALDNFRWECQGCAPDNCGFIPF